MNLPTTVDALPYLASEKNVAMFEKHGVLMREEIASRTEIYLQDYCKKIHIESITMTDMTRRMILPAITAYVNELAETSLRVKELGLTGNDDVLTELTKLYDKIVKADKRLAHATDALEKMPDGLEKAKILRDRILPAMERLRAVVDKAELLTAAKHWPMPTYANLLFSEN